MYSQPDFYHFSEDSIKLVKYALEQTVDLKEIQVADFCAGSGVVGIEYSINHKSVSELFLLEIQKEFIPFLESNTKLLPSSTRFQIENKSLSDFCDENNQEKFDLILSNPPYFLSGEGRTSPSVNKQYCRTFEHDNFKILFGTMEKFITEKGRIFFLGRLSQNELKNYLRSGRILLCQSFHDTGIFELLR